jgi:hypothetical protein
MHTDSPYKFLDYYEFNKENPEPFFGRQSETQILLSDILVSRLVVLFAQTGTGKTSLINAGVRPLLEKRDYKHVLIRVRNDPAESARAELRDYLKVDRLEGDTLPKQLEWSQQQVSRPLVLFFDQFEEFFLQAPTPASRQRVRQFVSDIANLYESSDNGVHIVFSMREEWFVKMDLFREHIPELFENESSLRLRFFQPVQAREAIVGPAELRGVEIEEDLIVKVISDLTNVDDEIEPAQLQIICDSIWRNKAEDTRITLDDYRRLDLKYAPRRKRPGATISQNVLTGRLVEAFEKLNSASELNLLSRLLPQLATDADTKSFRDLESLAAGLEIAKAELKQLADYLESSGLIRTLDRGDLTFIELAHDYLAHRHRLKDLQDRVKAIWPRKLLNAAYEVYVARGSKISTEIKTISDEGEDRLSPENLQTITENIGTSDYNDNELEFLFRWALSRGVITQVETWFGEARNAGVDVWKILEELIDHSESGEATENAVYLLGRLKENQKWYLLGKAIDRADLALVTIEVLGNMPERESMDLLQTALSGAYRDDAIDALGRLRTASALKVLQEFLGRGEADEYTLGVLERVSKRKEDAIANVAKSIIARFTRLSDGRGPVVGRGRRTYPPISDRRYARIAESSYQSNFTDRDFDVLLERIAKGRCLPILGAGINSASVRPGGEIARFLAEEYEYPFDDPYDLPKVLQFMAVNYDSRFPRDVIAREYEKYELPDANQPLGLIASLPLNLHITTNYDDFLQQQLSRENKDPLTEYCRWNTSLSDNSRNPNLEKRPSIAQPLVYHLHGVSSVPESMVLTEDDYYTHLANLSRRPEILPNVVQHALSSSSLLFLGLNIGSPQFRLLFSLFRPMLETSLSRGHMCVQLVPAEEQSRSTIMKYFDLYFRTQSIKIYWGSVEEFTSELHHRWASRHAS